MLLVEDEPSNREVALEMLNNLGLEVESAEDGEHACTMAQQSSYDLILMDLQMPRMNGTDATRAIRGLSGYERIPILAMTANVFEEDRQRCLEAGMNDHITKPIDHNNLCGILVKWLRSTKVDS